MTVRFITATPDTEKVIAYCARVSSSNQDNPEYTNLLRYCIRHKHWSVFETASMTVEIETSRAIAAQLLRHRSFTFQEHSQRYAKAQDYVPTVPRKQAATNRQSSTDDLNPAIVKVFKEAEEMMWALAYNRYEMLLSMGVARESARMLLPLSTKTRLYMTGNIRSWIHYLELRTNEDTQAEHREIAEQIKVIFQQNFPIIYLALTEKP